MRRRLELRIQDPATHPRRYVSLRVAAEYLEVDARTFNKILGANLLAYSVIGQRRKVEVKELIAYEARQRKAG